MSTHMLHTGSVEVNICVVCCVVVKTCVVCCVVVKICVVGSVVVKICVVCCVVVCVIVVPGRVEVTVCAGAVVVMTRQSQMSNLSGSKADTHLSPRL